MLTKNDIRRTVSRVVDLIKPNKVILFGSYSSDFAKESSDVDLLVIVNENVKKNLKLSKVLRDLNPAFAIDLIVRSEEDIATRLKYNDFFIKEIFEKGQVLYDSSNS